MQNLKTDHMKIWFNLLYAIVIPLYIIGCTKKMPPSVETYNVKFTTQTTAIVKGIILNEGSYSVKERGICWDTLPDVKINKFSYSNCPQTDTFLCPMLNLVPGKKYYVKAFARNEFGIDYGTELEFYTIQKQSFIDLRDGNEYLTVEIGNQVWMAQNVRYNSGEGTLVENNNLFYNWETACSACPDGWHLPSDDEWKSLELFLGMPIDEIDNLEARGSIEAGKLKEPGVINWEKSSEMVTNATGFTAKGYGNVVDKQGKHQDMKYNTIFWSSTKYNNISSYTRMLRYNDEKIYRKIFNDSARFSVRCLKD